MLLIFSFLLRIRSLMAPNAYELTGSEGPLFFLFHNIVGANLILESIITTLIIFLQGFMINRIVMNHNLIRPPNFVTGFCFIVLASLSVEFFGFSNMLLANFLLLFAFNELFLTYKMYRSAIHIFNAGFLMALASLIHFPLFFLYFACSVTLLLLRSFKIRERLQLLTGFMLPFYLICLWFYMQGNLSEFIDGFLQFRFESFPMTFEWTSDNVVLFTFLLFMLISIIYYRRFVMKKGLEIEKKIDALYWLALFSLPTAFLSGPLHMSFLFLLALPLSIFMAMFLLSIRQKVIVELIAIFLVLIVAYIHFYLS